MSGPPSPDRRLFGGWEAPLVLLVAYGVAMVLLAASSYIDFRNARDLEVSNGNVSRTLEATDKLRQIVNTFFIAESSQRSYLLSGKYSYLASYRDLQQRMPVRLDEADRLIADTPTQRAGIANLRLLAARQFGEMDRMLDAYRERGQAGALAVSVAEDLDTMVSVRDQVRAMLNEEGRLLEKRRSIAAAAYSNGVTRAGLATGFVGLALTGFFLFTRRFLRQRDAALAVVEATNADLEQRVLDRTADLSHLSRHLLDVREHEKKIIARDLHDDFGSYLTAINMDVSRARDKIAATNPEQAAKLDRTLGLLGSAIEMKRQLISDLRPSILDNLGLGPALEQYIDEWSRRTGIAATFDFSGELDSSDEGCPIAIFRVFQEALTNVARHSKANRVAAHAYRVDDAIEFEIADNGSGLTEADRAKPGVHGLLGIRERVLAYGGSVEFANGGHGGVVVTARMPCHVASDPARAAASFLHFA